MKNKPEFKGKYGKNRFNSIAKSKSFQKGLEKYKKKKNEETKK